MKLLKTQQNDIHDFLVAYPFDPAEFYWGTEQRTQRGAGEISVLVHRPSGFYFKFVTAGTSGYFNATYAPAKDKEFEIGDSLWPWSLIPQLFMPWLECLRREVDAPSLWDEVVRRVEAMPFLGSMEPGGNTPFDRQEIEALEVEIDTLRGRVDAVCKLTDEQAMQLDEGLAYMRGALSRLGRFDWRHAVAGALITSAAKIAVPAVGRLLLHYAMNLMGATGTEVHLLPPSKLV